MTTTQTDALARPFWLPDGCPEWCEVPHSDDDHPDDRIHYGPERSVNLRLEPPVEGWENWRPDRLVVCLRKHTDHSVPQVDLRRGDDPTTARMTLSEARELAAALLAVVEEAS
jgi:hypothetical protein